MGIPPKTIAVAVAVAWVGFVGAGFAVLEQYTAEAGAFGTPASVWPDATTLPDLDGAPRLIVFAHPHCPCTRASIRELERLMRHAQPYLTADVLFIQPGDSSWAASDLWRMAEAIPGVRITADPGGQESQKFGIMTSGHASLYAADGLLQFSGGITPARGHEGDSRGKTAILGYLQQEASAISDASAVFGCSLRNPERAEVQP
ncbi:MAG: RedB protein [Bacteroidota bacterium]